MNATFHAEMVSNVGKMGIGTPILMQQSCRNRLILTTIMLLKRSCSVFRGRLNVSDSLFALMKMFVNFFGQCGADAFDLCQVFYAGCRYAAQAAEAGEQGLAAFGTYAGDFAE
ncbi:Uncharacterised protein [Neisseria animaloris]|uniref:Uncharacterized protein n=1 Tax=Neisseria animaloris TaxID=326522 RepID=A0A448UD72_9NEIS|nr:Uncharacterised protein [Neisseria animaloris]